MLNTGKIYLHKILGITLCWTLWEDLFTQNTEEYCMLNTVGRFIYTKYRGKMYVWALWEDLFKQNTEEYCMLNTVGRFIYTKYWGIYCMLSTVSRFIYTKYWGILYVEHCGKIYLLKILRNTLCWTLWEDLFTQNTEEYCMLSTVRRFIYTKYWGLLLVEHCGNIYLHKLLGNTLCWTLGKFIYTKYWRLLYVEHCGKIYLHKILYVEHCGKIYLHKIPRKNVCLSTVGRFI